MALLDTSAAVLQRNGDVVAPPERSMPSAKEVAKYFLALAAEEDLISNRRLQTLLYYAQGFHLAMYREPLFPETVVAWTMGPVVPEVWREYQEHESNAIPPTWVDLDAFTDRESGVIKEVYCEYGQYSAWKLALVMSNDGVWNRTRHGAAISHKRLLNYCAAHLSDEIDETPPR